MSSIIDAIKRKTPGYLQNGLPLYERKRGVFVTSTVVVLISLYEMYEGFI